MLGFLLALWQACSSAKKAGDKPISQQDIVDASVWLLIIGLICARAVYVFLDSQTTSYTLKMAVAIWNGGISFDGALVGGLVSLIVFCKNRKLPLLSMLDLIAPAAVIGYAVGRIGCFFNGCCYGGECDLPWAVKFQIGKSFGLPIFTEPSHPVQLYSTLISLVLFGVLMWVKNRKNPAPGVILGCYLIGSAIERFIMELFRKGVTAEMFYGTFLTQAQAFCIVLLATGAGLTYYFAKRQPKIASSHADGDDPQD
jgi:phosphatidylglycerol:prolipoprotein diacylglycerol transferase